MQRYGLSDIVEKSQVMSIVYDNPTSVFTIEASTGTKKARTVVLAIGSGQTPCLPQDSPFHNIPNPQNVTHIFSHLNLDSSTILAPSVLASTSFDHPKILAIIGGGLTSAQIAELASSQGLSKVHLILRSPLKTKHFDVDLCWLAKYKNESMSRFWKADEDRERWEMMRDARGGGSVNPEYREVLKTLVREGRVKVWEWTKVKGARWDDEQERWRLELTDTTEEVHQVDVDGVVYATSEAADIRTVNVVRSILEEHPIEIVGGLPCLTNELMWNEDIPLFVTGKLGGLRLGPAAPNLEGARLGAEFISSKIAILSSGWQRGVKDSDESPAEEFDMGRLGLGRSNQFEILEYDSEEGGNVHSVF